jgi:hypothetical protein
MMHFYLVNLLWTISIIHIYGSANQIVSLLLNVYFYQSFITCHLHIESNVQYENLALQSCRYVNDESHANNGIVVNAHKGLEINNQVQTNKIKPPKLNLGFCQTSLPLGNSHLYS